MTSVAPFSTPVSPPEAQLQAWREGVFGALHSARRLCRRTPDLEVVGLIWTDSSVSYLINQARATDRFSVSEGQFAEVLAEVNPDEKTWLSLFHSHPSGSVVPSRVDRESIRGQWENGISRPWTIVDPNSDRWGLWWAEETEIVGEEHYFSVHRIPAVKEKYE